MNTKKQIAEFEGMPVFNSGLTLGELDLSGGVVFWEEVTRFTAQAQLQSVLDEAAAGKPVPRIWAVLDDSEDSSARVAAALSLARMLSNRDQQVIILDADDSRPDLTRWAGRAEQEGWIDLVRYGASMSACSIPLPWEGRGGQFIGVGSFCPTRVDASEVEQLVGRLRRQTDDLIFVAPMTETGLTWASHATLNLLCWDGLSCNADEMQTLIADLKTASIKIVGIVGFGLDELEILESVAKLDPLTTPLDSGPVEVDDEARVTSESIEQVEREPAAMSGETDDIALREPLPTEIDGVAAREPAPAAEESTSDLDWIARSDQEEDREPAVEPGEPAKFEADEYREYDSEEAKVPPNATLATERERAGAVYPEVTWVTPRRRRTSPLFWGLASVLILAVVILGGWWIRMQFFQQEESEPTLASLSSGMDINRPVGDGFEETEREVSREVGAEDLATEAIPPPEGSTAPGDRDVSDQSISDRSLSDQTIPETSTGTIPRTESESIAALPTPDKEVSPVARTPSSVDRSEYTADQDPARSDPSVPADPVEMDPYQGKVGAAGWAVHLYSLPDSMGAQKQVAWLARKGIEAEWLAVNLGSKGRWYRVFAGSFPTKEAAQQALPALKQRLGLDWAMPKRY